MAELRTTCLIRAAHHHVGQARREVARTEVRWLWIASDAGPSVPDEVLASDLGLTCFYTKGDLRYDDVRQLMQRVRPVVFVATGECTRAGCTRIVCTCNYYHACMHDASRIGCCSCTHTASGHCDSATCCCDSACSRRMYIQLHRMCAS